MKNSNRQLVMTKKICAILCILLLFTGCRQESAGTFSEPHVVEISSLQTLSVNSANAFAVDNDGVIWGWGLNQFTRFLLLDIFLTGNAEELVPVPVFDSVKGVSSSGAFVLALRKDNTLWGWGCNEGGQLGLGRNTLEEKNPVKIMGNVAAASAGRDFSVILKADGSLWVSGHNYYGVLGNGTRTEERLLYDSEKSIRLENDTNKFIKAIENICSFDVCLDNIIAVDQDNSLWAWGRNTVYSEENEYNHLIIDEYQTSVNSPKKIMDNVYAACAAYDRFYILTFDGSLIEWKSPNNQKVLMNNVKSVSAHGMTVAVITEDDSLFCRGLPISGHDKEDFLKIAENVAYAAASNEYIAYIDKQSRLFCSGSNRNGLAGNGEKVQREENSLVPGWGNPDPDRDLSKDYVYPPIKIMDNISYKP